MLEDYFHKTVTEEMDDENILDGKKVNEVAEDVRLTEREMKWIKEQGTEGIISDSPLEGRKIKSWKKTERQI